MTHKNTFEYLESLLRIEDRVFQEELLEIVSFSSFCYSRQFLSLIDLHSILSSFFSLWFTSFHSCRALVVWLSPPVKLPKLFQPVRDRALLEGTHDSPFSVEEIKGGILKQFLKEEDYIAPLQVLLL